MLGPITEETWADPAGLLIAAYPWRLPETTTAPAIAADADRDHEAVLLALDGDDLIGFCGLVGTALRPSRRGQRIAMALKVRAIDPAIARGERSMRSATGPPAMLHINHSLAFRTLASEVRLAAASW